MAYRLSVHVKTSSQETSAGGGGYDEVGEKVKTTSREKQNEDAMGG